MAAGPAPARIFTIADANAALPELARRVDRLREIRDRARRIKEFLDILWQRLDAGEPVLTEIGERQRGLDALSQEFARLVDEVDAFGVVLRDLDSGLVDFPARVRGMPIYLCWRAGETRVAYWHGPTEGYAGRKSIATIANPSGPLTS